MPIGRGAGEDFEVYLEFADSGKRLNEYKNEYHQGVSEPAHTDVWMECEPSAMFKIVTDDMRITGRSDAECVGITVRVDGRVAARRVTRGTAKSEISTIFMEKDGGHGNYPLQFSSIETVDALGQADLDLGQALVIGSIRVELEYGTGVASTALCSPIVVKKLGTVYEEHAKMGSMVNGDLSTLAPVEVRPHKAVSFKPAQSEPFYVFNIKYCTKIVLQKNGICPPDVTLQSPIRPIVPRQPLSQPRKRIRSPSVSSESSSSSSSSSSSESDDPLEGASGGMLAVFMNAMNAAAKAKAEKRRKKKAEKKLKKKAKKQKRKEARKEGRDSGPAKDTVDLTGDTDEEVEEAVPPAAGAVTRASTRASNVSFKVKKERLAG